MPNPPLATLALLLSRFSLHFGRRSFFHHLVLLVGWLLTESEPHAVTSALVAARVSASLDWWPLHRFFSRARWDLDRLGLRMASLLREQVPSWSIVIDDTLFRHKGAHVFGATMHVDPVTSTGTHRNFVRGHCWVILSVVFSVPWSPHPWSVPLLFRLYRGKGEGPDFPKKTELAHDLLEVFLGWLGTEKPIRVLLDSGYMVRDVTRGWPPRVVFVGALRTSAALYTPLAKPVGRRRRGDRLPTPARMRTDGQPWDSLAVTLYGKSCVKQIRSQITQWWHVFGDQPGRLVVVREESDKVRVFFCTDPTLSASELLVAYSFRWPQEVWHWGGKQLLGFAASSARNALAVQRTAPWVGLLTGVLVLWFWQVWRENVVHLPVRPWYPQKEGLSLADVVRAARRKLGGVVDVEKWAWAIVNREEWVFDGALGQERSGVSHPREGGASVVAA